MKKVTLMTIGLLSFSLVSLANAELTRDHATQVVTDSDTKLQWEDNSKDPIKKNWGSANEHCDNLDFAGSDDWRLPSFEELETLAKVSKVKFPEKPILKSLPTFGGTFWTSETMTKGESAAVGIKFDTFDYGDRQEAVQDLEYSVRCVRVPK